MKEAAKKIDFILDCSVTMAWCFEDEITEYSEHVFDAMTNSIALVPAIWTFEVANVLIMAERKKRISSIKVAAFKEALSSLTIHVDESSCNRALSSTAELAKQLSLTSYDAAYLELALHHNVPLATLDTALKRAAEKVNVGSFFPND